MSKRPMSAIVETAPRAASARRYSEEFKRNAVRLVTGERHTFNVAAEAVGVSEKSRRTIGPDLDGEPWPP